MRTRELTTYLIKKKTKTCMFQQSGWGPGRRLKLLAQPMARRTDSAPSGTKASAFKGALVLYSDVEISVLFFFFGGGGGGRGVLSVRLWGTGLYCFDVREFPLP